MPFWRREKYPDNWEEISLRQRQSTDFTCEFCGKQNGETAKNKKGGDYCVCVAAAHKWPFDESNPDPELYTLCQGDHRRYDNGMKKVVNEAEHESKKHRIVMSQEGYEACYHPDCGGGMYLPHSHDD